MKKNWTWNGSDIKICWPEKKIKKPELGLDLGSDFGKRNIRPNKYQKNTSLPITIIYLLLCILWEKYFVILPYCFNAISAWKNFFHTTLSDVLKLRMYWTYYFLGPDHSLSLSIYKYNQINIITKYQKYLFGLQMGETRYYTFRQIVGFSSMSRPWDWE